MKKLIYFLGVVMLICGCATTSAVTPKLSLGMTKQEVLAKCGNPTQSGAIKDKEGRTLESFMYRETLYEMPLPMGGYAPPAITYVYFIDGKVIYFGSNSTVPTEQKDIQPQALQGGQRNNIGRAIVQGTASGMQSSSYQDTSQQQFQQQQQQALQMMRDAQQSTQQYYRDIANQQPAVQPMQFQHTTCRWVNGQYICDSQQY